MGGNNRINYWLDIELLDEGKNFVVARSYEQFQDLLIQFSSFQCSLCKLKRKPRKRERDREECEEEEERDQKKKKDEEEQCRL